MSPRQLVPMGAVLGRRSCSGESSRSRAARHPMLPKSMALPRIDTATVDSGRGDQRGRDSASCASVHGAWRVNGSRRPTTRVLALLQGLADTTSSSEQVAESHTSHERFGVAADSGERVRVSSRGRVVLDLVTGKRTADYGGLYARRSGDDAVYAVHGGLADGLSRPIGDWRDKHIVAVIADSVATIAIQRSGRAYTVQRAHQGWRFGSGAPADSAAVSSLLNQYRDLTAVGFATTAEADSAHFSACRPPRASPACERLAAREPQLRFDGDTRVGACGQRRSRVPALGLRCSANWCRPTAR